MAVEPTGPAVARAAAEAGARMIEDAQRSVAQVRSGRRGAGAGVIPADGLVLTNEHVVAGRRGGKVRVILHDGRSFDAEVARRSRSLDLALLRLRDVPDDPPTITFGDSDALRVGELVYAVGHPWGRPGAVTAGIVSGLLGAARGPGGDPSARYVQSDVSLAPGNSGGPLLNARGEVVGINAMVFGRRLALSVPSNAARAWLDGTGSPRPRLGVGVVPVELPASMRQEATEGSGLVIAAVEGGGPAERAGLLVGDVLLGAGDEPLADAGSLLRAVARTERRCLKRDARR